MKYWCAGFFGVFSISIAVAQVQLNDSQKNEYCKGISIGQIAVIASVLSPNGNSITLDQIKVQAIDQAIQGKDMTELTRKAAILHINNFEAEQVTQMRQELTKAMHQMKLDRPTYLELFKKNIPSYMVSKFKDCKAEFK